MVSDSGGCDRLRLELHLGCAGGRPEIGSSHGSEELEAGRLICGIGMDMVEVERLARVEERHGDRFLHRIYTPLEIEKVHGNRHQYFAARFAAKEAVFKALGTGWSRGIRWVDVEVQNLPSGQPVMTLSGAARDRAAALGVTRLHLTISHTARHAVAQVLLEGTPSASLRPGPDDWRADKGEQDLGKETE